FGAVAKPFTATTEDALVLLKDGDLEISAFLVDHKPVHPAVGYRINYRGRSVVISGDTVKSASVQREAKGVDLLVHEAMSPEQAAETARDAGVRYLLLNHIAPPLPLPGLEKAFLGSAPDLFKGPIQVGSDGDFITLPVGSTQVKSGRLF
ncbi:MAG: hypothetical protein JZU63_08045, partial [Rhodoferax sp.]|nr:hypothetical protein [Rhodoferax sp.]